MKGVVLHGGAGTRLRPLTFSGPKQLIPVANKPVSQYVIEDLVSSGVEDIGIVLGETFPEMVREYYGDGSKLGCRITYIYQGAPLGIAHAVGLAKDFVGDEDFVVYLGDNLLQHGISKYVKCFVEDDLDAMILLKDVDDPRMFGVAKFDGGGNLIGLVEKPKEPPSKYAVIGVYFFKPVVFDVIRDLKPSWRGEYEITDTIQLMLDRGYRVGYDFVEGWWFDTGKKDDILKVNQVILDERAYRDVKGELVDSRVDGRVLIDGESKIVNSIVRGPSVIGEGCLIENSYIGPYTSVGDGCKIIDSSIEYSIVLENTVIEGIERIEDSLIGRRVYIRRNNKRRFISLHIGDYSELNI